MKIILGFVAIALLIYGLTTITLGYVAMKIPFGVVVIIGAIIGGTAAGLAWKQHETHLSQVDQIIKGEEITTRKKIYADFMSEKTRRISAYQLCLLYEMMISMYQAQKEANKPLQVKNGLNFMDAINSTIDKFEQAVKDKREEQAKFDGVISSIKLHFKDSEELRALLGQVIKPKPFGKIEKPAVEDMRNNESWDAFGKKANALQAEYIKTNIQMPLDTLGDYLKRNIN
jgi:hypothetical protein